MHTLMMDLSSCPDCRDLPLLVYEAPAPSAPTLQLNLTFSAPEGNEENDWKFNFLAAVLLATTGLGFICAFFMGFNWLHLRRTVKRGASANEGIALSSAGSN